MVYVLLLAFLWSAVGALVFFVRAKITRPQRLALTIGTSLAFGVIGFVDVSSIYHSAHSLPAVMAKASSQAEHRAAKATD